jgi:hypothetical protein
VRPPRRRIRFNPHDAGVDAIRSLFLLRLIAMPLDREEHARAEHENLERDEYDRDPIHYLVQAIR